MICKKTIEIVFYVLLIVITLCNNIAASENKKSSKYWSIEKTGPLTNQDAINKFFKNRKLKSLEGIWYQKDYGTVAIVFKEPNKIWGMLYSKYIIENKEDSSLNGTIEGSFHRTKYENYFIVFERYKNYQSEKNKNIFFTSTGTLNLINENFAEVKITSSKNIRKINKFYLLEKIYP